MTQINKEEFEIKGLPHFISCLKRLVEVYNIELKKKYKNDIECYEGNNDVIRIIAKPFVEKGRINIDINNTRLCEINTYEKYVRLAAPVNSPYLNDGVEHKMHKSRKFDSYNEFYNFIKELIDNCNYR